MVGIVPAAGTATRIAPLPLSKELFPVGFRQVDGVPRPAPVCEHLLAGMAAAGLRTVYLVLGDGKWDIPAYLGDGAQLGLDIAYLTIRGSRGVPFTVARANNHLRGATVAFGFPDIIFTPEDALLRLRTRLERGAGDVVLGVLPADRPETADVVDVDAGGRVRRILVKPANPPSRLAWVLAVWRPTFTRHLNERIAAWPEPEDCPGTAPDQPSELHMGHVLQSAVEQGLQVEAEVLAGSYIDVGTPEGLRAAVRARA